MKCTSAWCALNTTEKFHSSMKDTRPKKGDLLTADDQQQAKILADKIREAAAKLIEENSHKPKQQ